MASVALGRNYDVAPDGERFVVLEEVEPQLSVTELVTVQSFAEELKRLVPIEN